MHLGNLSFSMQNGNFSLLPVYDMCSMEFAPENDEVLPFEVTQSVEHLSEEASEMGQVFWTNLSEDDRISGAL